MPQVGTLRSSSGSARELRDNAIIAEYGGELLPGVESEFQTRQQSSVHMLMKRSDGSWCRARVVSCVQVVQAGSHESQASGQRGSLL